MVQRQRHTLHVEHRGQSVDLPVISLKGELQGPSVAITGNVHGDEITGVAAAHRLLEILGEKLQRGTVHVYPTLNPVGLASGSRGIGGEGPDLNRLFPGEPGSGLGHHLAQIVWGDLEKRKLGLLIDLHADSAVSIPYAIVDRAVRLRGTRRAEMDVKLLAYARATGLTVLHEYPDEIYLRFGLDRSLAGAVVNRLKIPAVTIEAGPRRVRDLDAIGTTVDAVLRILAYAGMVDPPTTLAVDVAPGGPWRRTSGPRTRVDGLLDPVVRAGVPFEIGEVLAIVRDLAGEPLDEVRAAQPGIVVSWVDGAWLGAGSVVATLGIPEGLSL